MTRPIETELDSVVYRLKHDYMKIEGMQINFQRTCKVPVGQTNSLPAGLGNFPVYRVADFKSGVPSEWNTEGYFMPMYRQEAMWINFGRGYQESPKALVIGAGNINAITGKPFDPTKDLNYSGKKKKGKAGRAGKGRADKSQADKSQADIGSLEIRLEKEQNYLVIPPQPWLDGWKAEDGKIYQFVAAEMGSGETVEGQITGEETAGGIQLIVYNPKPGQNLVHKTRPHEYMTGGSFELFSAVKGYDALPKGLVTLGMPSGVRMRSVQAMGLGRGGEIEQKIYPDPYGVEVWDEKPAAVDVIYLISSNDFREVTGHPAPPTPVTYEKYQQLGLPWFELHDKKYADTPGSDVFSKLKPVGEGKAKQILHPVLFGAENK